MTCATGLCRALGQGAAGAAELMVEHHGSDRGESGAGAATLRVRMSLAVEKIDSIRRRIGARCRLRPFSSLCRVA